MSWQAPQRLTKVCLPGPSGKSACACCALTGGAAHSRAAAIRAKSGVLDMAFSRNGCASLPQFLRSEPRALGERGELHPHDLGVDLQPAGEGAEAAIDAGDDVLGSHHARVLHDAVRHQLGMLDEVRGGIDHAGMMILPSGSFTSFHTFHSWPWRGFAPGNDSACGRPLSTMSTMSFSGTSLWWGPWVEAQQMCMRMRSGGMSLTAWLSASTWVVITLRNSSRLKWANTMWRLSARSGQSSCSTRPASTMARYSRAITSASAKR